MINRVTLVGNLGADPELKYTPGGQAVATLRLATTEKWNDKQGQAQERTEWHRVVVWGRSAETIQKYLKKGSQVYIEGKLQTRSWDDKDGTKKYMTEIVGQTVKFLGGRRDSSSQDEGFSSAPVAALSDDNGPPPFDQDDDIPF